MKRLPRGAVAWLVVTAASMLLHAGAGRWLADHDPIAGLLRLEASTVVAGGVLILTRLVLYFVVPGWLLYLVTDQLVTRRFREPDSGTGTGTGTG